MKTLKLNSRDASYLYLDANDVLSSEEARSLRDHDLRRGLILGNMYDETTGLIYYNKKGARERINAKIMAVTEKNVVLHNQRLIPIHRIHDVIV